MTATHNSSRFGFTAAPDDLGASGNWVFIINESNTIFKAAPPPGTAILTAPVGTPVGATPGLMIVLAGYDDWPTDALMLSTWSKMD